MLERIRMENFKCFEDQEVCFKNLTVVAGQNGAGKSSIIQSLLVLRQTYLQGSFDRLRLNGPLTRLGRGRDVLHEEASATYIAFTLQSPHCQNVWKYQYEALDDTLERLSSNTDRDNLLLTNIFNPEFHYLNSERVGPRAVFSMGDIDVSLDRNLGNSGELAAHFLNHYGDKIQVTPELRHPSTSTPQLKYQVEAWLSGVSPNIRIHTQANSNTDQVEMQYSFVRGKTRSNEYRTTNVAFGLTYSLPIVVAALSLKPGGLLIVENPEAHLHPSAQTSIGKLLALTAMSGVQVIVETHSDHILNAIRIAVMESVLTPTMVAFHFLHRPDEDNASVELVSPQVDRRGRLNDWPRGFFDEWDTSTTKLLG